MKMRGRSYKVLKEMEGFSKLLYNDVGGHCTIGYGELISFFKCNGSASEKPFKKGISKSLANAFFRVSVFNFEKVVNSFVLVKLKRCQFDALVCFVYNIGAGAFKKSTLLKIINEGTASDEAIFNQFRRWKYANKKIIRGLINRREKEILLWKGGI